MHLFFIDNLSKIDQEIIVKSYESKTLPKFKGMILFENEILPSDLYCYLYAKFGSPNGIQSIIRADDSDNLIHWDWTLDSKIGWVTFMGLNFRTEVHFHGEWDVSEIDKEQLIMSLKKDLKNYGKEISNIKKDILEDWEQFVNPYNQIKQAISQLRIELDKLELKPENESSKITKDCVFDRDFAKSYQVFFNKKVPIFKKYESIWQKTLGLKISSSGFYEIDKEFKIVNDFISYVLSCLEPNISKQVERIMNSSEFGINKNSEIMGILFPSHIADFSIPLVNPRPR